MLIAGRNLKKNAYKIHAEHHPHCKKKEIQ
jgi:hypothetical protein